MATRRTGTLSARLAALALLLVVPGVAAADPVEDFYKGKTVSMQIGYSPGGGYDLYARVLARHIGKYIPGKPSVVPQNRPGAGSLILANWLYNVAPKDGTVMGTFARGMAMEPLVGGDGTEFDANKFNWIGSITNEVSICGFTAKSGIRTWQDMVTKTYTVGGTGSGSDTDVFPSVLKNMFGAKLKLIPGFPGGADVVLAVERGELDGRCGWSWSSVVSRSKALFDSKQVIPTVQISLKKHPDLPDVPLVTEYARNTEELDALKLILSRQAMARPFAAPPGIPAERVKALRDAFNATMKDPEFLAETAKVDLEVQPVTGEEIAALIADLYRAPKSVVELAKKAMADPN